MSDSSLVKEVSTQTEDGNNNSKTQNQTKSNAVHIVDDNHEAEEMRLDKSARLNCINLENTIEPPADKKEEMIIDIEKFVDITGLKINEMSQRAPRRTCTIMGLYENMCRGGQQQQHRWRYMNQVWRQELPPQQPQQTVWTQYNTGQGQYGNGAYGYNGGGPIIYDPRSRNPFVALVMGLVFMMLAANAIFLAAVLTMPDLREFFKTVGWLIIVPVLTLVIIVNFALVCSPFARRPPWNFICLILTTACMSIFSAKITSYFRTEIIFHAILATGAVVFVCVILACSKFDFTSYLLYGVTTATAFSMIVMIVIMTMMVTGIMMRPVFIVLLIVGTLIQTLMLTMQLQMILGGKTIELSEADYALAAFLVYTSILEIFIKFVLLVGFFDHR